MANEIKLKINGDASGLIAAVNAAVSQIEKRLSSLKIPTGLASTGGGGSTAGTIVQGLAGRDASRGAGDNRALATAELQREGNKTLKEILTVLQKQGHQLQVVTSKQGQAQATASNGTGGGGNSVKTQSGGGVDELMSMFGGAKGAVMGAVGKTIAAFVGAGALRNSLNESERNAKIAQSSAFMTQGQGGQRLQSFLSGGAGEENLFNLQRIQAAQEADETMRKRAGGGAFSFANLARQATHWKEAAQSTATLFGRDPYGKEIAERQYKEQSDLQAENFQTKINSPEEALNSRLKERYLKNLQRDLSFQKQTGMSDTGFESFLRDNGGFREEQLMRASSAITAASGSTRSAKDNAKFALQMGRQFDLTNAPQALGAISGQMGSSQLSKDALIKVQAEGTRIGVNQSDFREENRRFVEMASNLIGQSTATSGADIDRLLNTFGKFVTSTQTTSGQQAGAKAFQAYQEQTGTQTGPGAAMRVSGIVKHPVLGKLSIQSQAKLFSLKEKDLTSENFGSALYDPNVIDAAKKAGLSPEDYLAGELGTGSNAAGGMGIMGTSIFANPGADAALKNARAAQAQVEKDKNNIFTSRSDRKRHELEAKKTRGELSDWVNREDVGSKLSPKEQNAEVDALIIPDDKKRQAARLANEKIIADTAESDKKDRKREVTTAEQAKGDELYAVGLPLLKKSMEDAKIGAQQLTLEIVALNIALQGGNAAKIKAAVAGLSKSLGIAGGAEEPPTTGPQ